MEMQEASGQVSKTYRERRLAKAERLREWAEKRETKAAAAFETADRMASVIPFGQPILVGHHSEGRDRRYRDRIGRNMDAGLEHSQKARDMARRADGIEAAAAGAIYSDDPDAVEALEARLEALEAERERYKAHNREMRKPGACDHPADCDCRSRFPRDCKCTRHPLPAYVLQNLSGNIKRNRDRLEALKIDQRRAQRCEDAGGIAVEPAGDGYVCVTFSEKPAQEVRDALKGAGFHFRRGSWWGKADALPEGVAS
jgi:uncharacterized protein DUF3560